MLDPKHIHQHKTKISKADISNITVAALARCLRFVHNLTNQMIFAVRRFFTKFMRTATEVNIIHKKVEMSLVLALRICQLQNELGRRRSCGRIVWLYQRNEGKIEKFCKLIRNEK